MVLLVAPSSAAQRGLSEGAEETAPRRLFLHDRRSKMNYLIRAATQLHTFVAWRKLLFTQTSCFKDKQRYRRGSHAGYQLRLCDSPWLILMQLLLHLYGKPGHAI